MDVVTVPLFPQESVAAVVSAASKPARMVRIERAAMVSFLSFRSSRSPCLHLRVASILPPDCKAIVKPSTAPGAADSAPLVAVNPGFFDKSRPRYSIQIITVAFGWLGYSEGFIGAKRQREILSTTDWAQVAKLLD